LHFCIKKTGQHFLPAKLLQLSLVPASWAMAVIGNPAFLLAPPLNFFDVSKKVFFEEESAMMMACKFLFPSSLTFLELATVATVHTLFTDVRPPATLYAATTW
jgi:hypothetical protein